MSVVPGMRHGFRDLGLAVYRGVFVFDSLPMSSIELAGKPHSMSTERVRKVSGSINKIKLSFETSVITNQ